MDIDRKWCLLRETRFAAGRRRAPGPDCISDRKWSMCRSYRESLAKT